LTSQLYFHWKQPRIAEGFATGVSLHGHTLHSQESLAFIPRFVKHMPALEREMHRLKAVFQKANGYPLNFNNGWWTPPISAAGAVRLESKQIEELGLAPIVSITDHDNLDAHRMSETASVELTVPLGSTFLHLGIHGLPVAKADEVLNYGSHSAALMGWLSRFPEVLVVVNHPLWDEADAGTARHRAAVERFLAMHTRAIHALELNGLRPWKENHAVVQMAEAWGLPVISGGDRHGIEPNANINLTRAANWNGFVEEIRYRRESHVLFMPQYRRPFRLRILSNLIDILQDHPAHAFGWKRWSERAFYRTPDGDVRSLAAFWTDGEPGVIRAFLLALQMARTTGNFVPIRMASNLLQECRP